MSSQWKRVPDDDWRRRGQEKYLAGVSLRQRDWFQPSPAWDHDHCEFCMAKFGLREDWLRQGYATEDLRWICAECFADFREEFAWVLLADTPRVP